MAFTGRINKAAELTQTELDNNFLCHYPIGAIYMNANRSDSPNIYIGYGIWKKYAEGRVLLGEGGGFSAGATGGTLSHAVTISEMPSHNHNRQYFISRSDRGHSGNSVLWNHNDTFQAYSSYTGGDEPHRNDQPYITVYMWERTAK